MAGGASEQTYINMITSDHITSSLSLSLIENPSSRLTKILSQHNLPKPVYILEHSCGGNKTGIKNILNSIAGVYICINLVNGKMYVGSAAFNRMFRRCRAHLYLAAGGSKLVNRSVLKYGLINFAFVVIETISPPAPLGYEVEASIREEVHNLDKKAILSLEQKYLDLLNPAYNIVKIAARSTVLNLK